MYIKDPGLRRRFEGMLNDNKIDVNEIRQLKEAAQDYNVVTETEKQDLHRILSQLSDRLTPAARRELGAFLGVDTNPSPANPADTGRGASALNVMMQALSGKPLDEMNLDRSEKVFKSAEKGGVSVLEERKLQEVYTKYSSNWSSNVRRFWQSGIASLRRPEGAVTRRPGRAAEPEDLSSDLRTFWMQGYDDDVQRAFVEDMVLFGFENGVKVTLHLDSHIPISEVADELTYNTGLSLNQLDDVLDIVRADGMPRVWGEDNRVLTDGNDVSEPVRVLIPPRVSDNTMSLAMLYTADEGYHPTAPGEFQGAVSDENEGAVSRDIAEDLGRPWELTDTYIEGGNLVPGTTSDGEAYALVGRDSLVISAFHLDGKGEFSRSEVRSMVRKMEADGAFDPSEVDKIARKLSAMDYALDNGWFESFLNYPDYLPQYFNVNSASRNNAKEFLAKLELTKEKIGDDMGIDTERLVFVEQPEFHIDMAMRPLGPGEVMVHHPRKSIEIIDKALQDRFIEPWERQELLEMRQFAQHELSERGDVYDKIAQQLEDAGLLVTSAPGIFQSSYRKANFMNAVPGKTPDGSSNYIVIGSSIKPLERAFESFVKDLGVDYVHYVGNQEIEDGLTAGEISLDLAGGIDCRESSHAGFDDINKDLLHRYINNL